MKDKIRYEYHIDALDMITKPDYCMFKKEEDYFYFTKFKRDEKEFWELLNLYQELKKRGYPVNEIVLTVNNSLFVKIDDYYYVLIRVRKPMEEYNLVDMLNIWNNNGLLNGNNNLVRSNWAKLWSDKVDYFEYQVKELGKDKKVVLNTFGYFIGLAENAISYVSKVEKYGTFNGKLNLCHRRVWFPNYHLNYDNPLQFVIDLEVRDVAEYLKFEALEDTKLALSDLKYYLQMRPMDRYQLGMLYGRLLYPSYYFDLYEEVMNNHENEDKLLKITDKVEIMESFLTSSFDVISKYGDIEPVLWIMKKEL